MFPLRRKEGNHILFAKYAGTEIKIDGEDFLIREEEVARRLRRQERNRRSASSL